MKDIDLSKIIESNRLDFEDIAALLFPENKHPRAALRRIVEGDSYLDSRQISRLASYLNLGVEDLYRDWQGVYSRKGVHRWELGEFTAELDTATWITKIFHRGSLFHDAILHKDDVALSEYFNTLNNIIENFKKEKV